MYLPDFRGWRKEENIIIIQELIQSFHQHSLMEDFWANMSLRTWLQKKTKT